jgi:pantoate--beta-alanine ligase
LGADERRRALALSRALRVAVARYEAGETSAESLRAAMLAEIATAGEGIVDVEYIAVLRDGTVESVETIDGPTTIAIAARVGQTRLIDNVRIG